MRQAFRTVVGSTNTLFQISRSNCETGDCTTKRSRLILILSIGTTCGIINYRLVTTGHYRLPALVFFGSIFAIAFVARWRFSPTLTLGKTRSRQLRAASAFRRLGFIFAGGLILGLVNLVSGKFKDIPTWAILLLFCWSCFLISICFWLARRYQKHMARNPEVVTKPQGSSE